MLKLLTFVTEKYLELYTTHTYTLNTLDESREAFMMLFITLSKPYMRSLV